jgi:hypothetical protein
MVDVRVKVITIFKSVQDVGLLEEVFEKISGSRTVDYKAVLEQIASFTPVMRFILKDEPGKGFRIER